MPSTTSRMPSTRVPLPGRAAVDPRRTTGVTLTALALAALAAACGQGTPDPSGTPAGSTTRPGGTASGSSLTRTGGVAGFDDELAVAADGHVTGSTKSAAVDCSVPPETAQTLATAPAPSVAPAAGTDRMTVTLHRDTGSVDLGEAQGSDPLSTTARELLDDVQQPEGQRTVCR